MNLYTICTKDESLYELQSIYGVKFQDYSMNDYNYFMDIAKKHYIHRLFSWYETDMSDSDSGTINDNYPINYTNIVIKDNELYGVLVKTKGMFPKYYLLEFEKKHKRVTLGGGYNDLDYDWWIKDKDISNLDTLNVSSNYVIIYEKISYDNNKLSYYEREIIGFLQRDCIIKNDCIIGLKYEDDTLHEFIFSDKDSFIQKHITENGQFKSVINMKLVEINEEFLNMNIIDVTYKDFTKGNFKLLDL